MRARCPSCGTGYQLRAGAVQPGQRMRFRCKRCDSNVVVTGTGVDKRATMQTRRAFKGETGRYEIVPYADLEEAHGAPPAILAEAIPLADDDGPPPLTDSGAFDAATTPLSRSDPGRVQRVMLSPASSGSRFSTDADGPADESGTLALPESSFVASASAAPPPVPDDEKRPEHLKRPLPKPRPPTGFVPAQDQDGWPAAKAYTGIAIGTIIGFGVGAIVAASYLGGAGGYDDEPESFGVDTRPQPAAARAVTSAADDKAAADEPVASRTGATHDVEGTGDAATQQGALGDAATASGASAAMQVADPPVVGGPEAEEQRGRDTTDVEVALAKGGEVSDKSGKPERSSDDAATDSAKAGDAAQPSTKGRTKKRQRRSWKRRAKAALKRCDRYHRKVYEMRKAVRRGAITGDGDPADEMHVLQRFLQGKGGVVMDEAMAEVGELRTEARESRPTKDQKWFARQATVTCEKSGRYPPNP